MSLNPLAPVTDYQSMLNRIFWFTTGAALIGIWILRMQIPALDRLLREIDFTVEFGGNKVLPIPGGYLFPALAVGLVTRIYRLHARVSDWLGIREDFDIEVIIGELAAQLAIDISWAESKHLIRARHHIMRNAFYKYVTGPQPQIDSQLVHQALDAWSWFWIGVEATLVFVIAGFVLVSGGVYETGFQLIGGTLVLAVVGLPAMRDQCRRYAVAQVRAIVADPDRAAAVRTAFAELNDQQLAGRLAA
jgi:hypothetical protein